MLASKHIVRRRALRSVGALRRPAAASGRRLASTAAPSTTRFDVAVVGGGAAGMTISSLLRAKAPSLRVALIDPSDTHYYQPAWTLVGSGDFKAESTRTSLASLVPAGVEWIRRPVVGFEPESDTLRLGGLADGSSSGATLQYDRLVVAPGLELNWGAIEGLAETLGANGVTSNYTYDCCQYTTQLVREMKPNSRAVFTQPPMPIKCAGAPQKALYLSASTWEKAGLLPSLDLAFYASTPALFGVADFVPTLMSYMQRYGASLHFQHTLVKVDGPGRVATFKTADGATVETRFDMLHVVPPQRAPAFIRESPLADASGFVDVCRETLRHSQFANVYGAGDVINAPNAKTMAAARKQAPILVHNLLQDLAAASPAKTVAVYDGYGACPLTVEKGKVVLAEFGWGGKLLPSFRRWLINNTQASTLAWHFKADVLPHFYWHIMLPGRDYLDPMSWPKIVPATEHAAAKKA